MTRGIVQGTDNLTTELARILVMLASRYDEGTAAVATLIRAVKNGPPKHGFSKKQRNALRTGLLIVSTHGFVAQQVYEGKIDPVVLGPHADRKEALTAAHNAAHLIAKGEELLGEAAPTVQA